MSVPITAPASNQNLMYTYESNENLKCGWEKLYELMILAVMDNLSIVVYAPEKIQVTSTEFEHFNSMPVQCFYQLSYEVTQLRARKFNGLKCKEWWMNRISIWNEDYRDMTWGFSNLMGSHLNFFRCIYDNSNKDHHFIKWKGLLAFMSDKRC